VAQLKQREVPIRIIVRRKHGGKGHHGGAWKVALADFMTAMFALFLVLWIVTQSTDIRSAVAGYFQDPLGRADQFGSSIMPGDGAQTATVQRPLATSDVLSMRRDRLMNAARRLEQELQKVPDLADVKDKVRIEMTSEGLRIQLIEDARGVFFESGSASPSGRGSELLGLVGAELGRIQMGVLIEGYTDARPYAGSSSYSNWELSADRANTARRIMTEHGLDPRQVEQIRGWADHQLANPADPLDPANRRVTITVPLEIGSVAPADTVPLGIAS
jgi:chemotaxis protein MotB